MRPQDPEVDKSAFIIDLEAQTATCPQGHTATGRPGPKEHGLPTFQFTFPRATCQACPLFGRCVKSKVAGRTVTTSPYETYLRTARQRQQTDEFKTLYPLRNAIERKQAELVEHGLRNTRYLGHPKRQLSRLWTAAAVNLRCLFRLSKMRKMDLSALLAGLEQSQLTVKAA